MAIVLIFGTSAACSIKSPPQALAQHPDKTTRQIVHERLTAIVVTRNKELGSWVNKKFAIANAPKDADGGSAAPISEDGYFLTADHVLAEASGKNVFIIYSNGGKIITSKARIVWRSAKDDLAILHIPNNTPYFYRWSDPRRRISSGQNIIHGGIATGSKSAAGALRTAIGVESGFTGTRPFKMDIPLEPGDSGGPVVDAYGNLVGINSAVEFLIPMETAIFMDSEGVRPNIRKIESIIQRDRNFHKSP